MPPVRDEATRIIEGLKEVLVRMGELLSVPGYRRVQEAIDFIERTPASQVEAGEVEPTDPAEMVQIAEAVAFYADPESWHGVYMAGCGPMGDDWSDVEHPNYPDGKPGKRAREAIDAYLAHRVALAQSHGKP